MTDDTETVVRTYDYTAFGTIDSQTGTLVNPFTYTAREYDDDNGLYYYRARFYDSSTGRFLGRDPQFTGGGISLIYGLSETGKSWYPYVSNNPLNLLDPLGEKTIADCDEQKKRDDDACRKKKCGKTKCFWDARAAHIACTANVD